MEYKRGIAYTILSLALVIFGIVTRVHKGIAETFPVIGSIVMIALGLLYGGYSVYRVISLNREDTFLD